MPESIIKGHREGFTVIYNSVLKDEQLSLKTIGLFAVMNSFPETWEYSISGLAARCRVGRDTIRGCLRELEAAGYLLREQEHDAQGRFGTTTFVLQERKPAQFSPLTEKPSTVKPTTEKPLPENRTQVKKQVSKETSSSPPTPQGKAVRRKAKREPKKTAEWKPERFEAFWTFYSKRARGENRQGAIRAWDRLQPSEELIAQMGQALIRQLATEEWQRGIGIPYASTWLNNGRWKDLPKAQGGNVSGRVVEEEEVTYI